MIARITSLLLLAAIAWGQDTTIYGVIRDVPAIVDLERIHFRKMLIREWRAYQQACKTDSFLVPTGYYTGHADTTQLDSLGRCFLFISTPDSAWVRRDPRSFPAFMDWIEEEVEK